MTGPLLIPADDERVERLTTAIQSGDVPTLRSMLAAHPELATARFGDEQMSRTVLHVATDWPGHFPHVGESIRTAVTAGADVDAHFHGPHTETALHWAASSDDVEALDALADLGADIEADGGVLTAGPPLDDAVIFQQWHVARRLVELGATTKLFHAAALDLPDRVTELLADRPAPEQVTNALWHACAAGAGRPARLLLDAGGDPRWVGYDGETPLDAARRSGDEATITMVEAAATSAGD